MNEKQNKIIESRMNSLFEKDKITEVECYNIEILADIARQLTIANEIAIRKAEAEGIWKVTKATPPSPDALVEAVKEARLYIRSTLPMWNRAEDLPPIMHKIDKALAAHEKEKL